MRRVMVAAKFRSSLDFWWQSDEACACVPLHSGGTISALFVVDGRRWLGASSGGRNSVASLSVRFPLDRLEDEPPSPSPWEIIHFERLHGRGERRSS